MATAPGAPKTIEAQEKREEQEEPWEKGDHPFFPHHVLDEVMILFALFGVVVTLAVLYPFHLHEPADPLSTPVGIKPEWYFLPMYQWLKYVPKIVGVLSGGVIMLLVILFPFIDEALVRRFRTRKISTIIGAVALVVMLLLGVLGFLSERTFVIAGKHVHFDLLGIPHMK